MRNEAEVGINEKMNRIRMSVKGKKTAQRRRGGAHKTR